MRLPDRLIALVPLVPFVALGCSGTPAPTGSEAAAGAPSVTATQPEQGSSWVEASVAKIRVDKGDAGGMRDCKGTLTPEAKTFFTKVYTQASKCAAAGPTPLKGSVTFHSTLEEGGGLSEFSVLDDKLGSPAAVKCFQEQASSVEFPKVDAKTPCVQLVHPMTFP